MNIGPTYRLLREEHEISQREMAKRIGVERNSLDRFEKTSKGLSETKVNNYKYELHLCRKITEKENERIKQLLENIFDHLFYTNRNYNSLFLQLQNLQSTLALTEYYPLLYIYDYCITIQNNILNYQIMEEKIQSKLNELSAMIKLVESIIPNNWLALYYDYVGERYRYEYHYQEALAYYEKAEKIANDDRHIAMINYRRAIAYTQINQNVQALEHLNKAGNIFQKYMNYEKCLNVEFLKAMIYDNLRDYDHAISIYERCLKVVEQGSYSLSKEQIYNNMIWALLMKSDYEKALQITNKAVNLKLNKKAVYLYKAIAYFALDIENMAKKALTNCEKCDEPFIEHSLNSISELLNHLLSKNEPEIERTISKIENEHTLSGLDILVLTYTLTTQYYKKENIHEKILSFMAKLHQL